jgi:uncharacterized protein (DUF2062 family)
VSVLVFASMFRLSKLVVFAGAMLNNPWTMVPMYGFCLWFGVVITGTETTVPNIAWKELTFRNAYTSLAPYLWPFVAGTVVAGLIATAIAYVVIYWAVVRYRKREVKLTASPR